MKKFIIPVVVLSFMLQGCLGGLNQPSACAEIMNNIMKNGHQTDEDTQALHKAGCA